MGATAAEIDARIEEVAPIIGRLVESVETVVVGQRGMVEGLLIGLLTGGHVLLEGVPGLAKTLAVNTLAKAIEADFARVQFTPDLLPADLIGTTIYNPSDATFSARKGPIFANIVLADEINRAPAKVQSALLEAMAEHQVTIGDTRHPLPRPFMVMATQNPIEQEGTYRLPEAQVDRFMLKIRIDYPTRDEELAIVDRVGTSTPDLSVNRVLNTEDIINTRTIADAVYVDDKIKQYAVDVVHATRRPAEYRLDKRLDLPRLIEFGASPRGTISLILAGRAHALLRGRGYVSPSDIKAVGTSVLRHRVVPSYEAEAEGVTSDDIVKEIFDHLPVP
ncbi:MAG: ATPase AAA [Phycisphaeraceae bacterium]|nr:MAG: ATPase AAA [Phycisphaeraceae bacterium]